LVEQIIETNKMNRKFIYYIIFAICFLLFSIVQDYIRPNYDGANGIIIYLLGVAPNFLPGIGLPALLYVVIPEVSKPNSSLFPMSSLQFLHLEEVSSIGMIFYGL
jgi:hypothetical protein